MAPATHAFIGWWVANACPLSRRDRLLVFLAGILPDLDGLGLLVSPEAYENWHHVLCHNLTAASIATVLVAVLAQERRLSVLLTFLGFHLHLACDYFGSGGPDGSVWVLPYFYPFQGGHGAGDFVGPAWYWNQWQWPLNAWPNTVFTLLFGAGWVYIAVRLDRTWFEMIWPRMDQALCQVLRKWLGGRPSSAWSPRESFWIERSLIGATVVVIFCCVLAGHHSSLVARK